MPLHVDIHVNEYPLESVHIGRLRGGTRADDVNTYIIVVGEAPLTLDDWYVGVEFTHRYGDGALVCVRKGLEAWEAAGRG